MTPAEPGRLLSEHVGFVDAPVERVRDAVLAVPTGRLSAADAPLVVRAHARGHVVMTGGPEIFSAELEGARLTIEVDRAAGWVQARGQWWWCGRILVQEHGSGTVVRQRTYNCATGAIAGLVPFTVGRGHRRDTERALRRLLQDLGERLGCDTRMLPDG